MDNSGYYYSSLRSSTTKTKLNLERVLVCFPALGLMVLASLVARYFLPKGAHGTLNLDSSSHKRLMANRSLFLCGLVLRAGRSFVALRARVPSARGRDVFEGFLAGFCPVASRSLSALPSSHRSYARPLKKGSGFRWPPRPARR